MMKLDFEGMFYFFASCGQRIIQSGVFLFSIFFHLGFIATSAYAIADGRGEYDFIDFLIFEVTEGLVDDVVEFIFLGFFEARCDGFIEFR